MFTNVRQNWLALLQPTSPFLLPAQIDACSEALRDNPEANSAQTVAEIPHNYHAFNQRVIKDGAVDFNFTEERKFCYNKQSKPHFYSFGNLVIT
ncbi:acylneuraminate cytidylyltransferase family protein, partial [Aduncisulcus paluster]